MSNVKSIVVVITYKDGSEFVREFGEGPVNKIRDATLVDTVTTPQIPVLGSYEFQDLNARGTYELRVNYDHYQEDESSKRKKR